MTRIDNALPTGVSETDALPYAFRAIIFRFDTCTVTIPLDGRTSFAQAQMSALNGAMEAGKAPVKSEWTWTIAG